MQTVSDFIRWLRERVIERSEVAGYEITLLFDSDDSREEIEEWFVDHSMKQVVIVGRSDETDEEAGDIFHSPAEEFYDDDD